MPNSVQSRLEELFSVEARKLEHNYPRALQVGVQGIPALIILHACSIF